MARKNEAEELLRQGSYPSEIAAHMGVSVKTVIQYLCTRVGEGSIRLSDLYFSWPPEKREVLQRASRGKYPDDHLLSSNGLCREELELFASLRGRRVFSGDLYEYISEAEIAVHSLVRTILESKFGTEETGWWRKGIPRNIRVECVSRREDEDEPCKEPYAYTTLIDLSTIISENWSLFQGVVPKQYSASRKQLQVDFRRLNQIRNAVMHPIKELTWSENDFELVRKMATQFKAERTG